MTRLQDNFFDAINGEWEKTAVIPDDKARTGGFSDLSDEIEALMLEQTDKWLAGEDLPSDPILQHFVAYHRLVADDKKRQEDGIAPAQDLIQEFRHLTSYDDFVANLAHYEREGKPNLLPFGISPDFMDARNNVLWAYAPDLILPDTTYYEKNHEKGQELIQLFRTSKQELLEKVGLSHSEAADVLDKMIEMDKKLADYVLSNEESSEYAKLYHPYQWDDFAALAPELPLGDFFQAILGQLPDQIIVPEKRFWTEFASTFYSKANWPYLKAYLLYDTATAYVSFLTDEIRVLAGHYERHLSGTPKAKDKKKAAYYLAQAPFSQALGLWYAKERFSAKAKADVKAKVARMIAVYKERLSNNDWLQKDTIQKAITKLDAITAHIGYPEKLPETYAKKQIDPQESLVANATRLAKISIAHAWSQWNKPVDRDEWHMPAHMVNAYYDPQQNQIVFPAAILQAPFYSLNQSSSANYGGIGAVIAHEISHAFDTNGASFDEHGSLSNWWTEKDYAAFKKRTDKMVEQFDGIDFAGGKVNGKLTVSENVADLGGLAAALAAAKQESDFSAEDYFTNFAKIWRMKAREEYLQLLISVDVHAPGKLRTNVQLPNFSDFLETFSVKPGDRMWRDEDNRLQIW